MMPTTASISAAPSASFNRAWMSVPPGSARSRSTPANAAGTEQAVRIVGVDEIDLNRNHISWKSPLARAFMKSGPGDSVVLHAPGGTEQLQILDVRYERIPMEPFSAPPGAEAAPKPRPRTGTPAAAAGDRSGVKGPRQSPTV